MFPSLWFLCYSPGGQTVTDTRNRVRMNVPLFHLSNARNILQKFSIWYEWLGFQIFQTSEPQIFELRLSILLSYPR